MEIEAKSDGIYSRSLWPRCFPPASSSPHTYPDRTIIGIAAAHGRPGTGLAQGNRGHTIHPIRFLPVILHRPGAVSKAATRSLANAFRTAGRGVSGEGTHEGLIGDRCAGTVEGEGCFMYSRVRRNIPVTEAWLTGNARIGIAIISRSRRSCRIEIS